MNNHKSLIASIASGSHLVPRRFSVLTGSIAASLLLFAFAQDASAVITLTYDLRVTAVDNGSSFTAKSAQVGLGSIVTVQLFGIVTGADNNGTNDGLTQTQGSFVSAGIGGIAGLWSAGGALQTDVNASWRGTGAQNGLLAVTDATGGGFDLGLDGGGSDTGVPAPNPYFVAQNTTATFGTGANNSTEFLLGTKTFTISAVGSNITLQFAARNRTNGTTSVKPIKWISDGVAFSVSNGDANLGYSAPVVLSAVPEPSAFGMLALGALGLVGFRRMGLRRTA